MGKYEYKYDRYGRGTEPTGRRVSDTRVPPNTEQDQVIICPWMDCLLKRESDESSSIGIRNYKKDPQWNETMDLHSDREPTSDESSWEDYEACSDSLEILSKEGGPVVPQTAFQTHIRNVAICRKKKIAQWGQGPMVETRTLVI